MLKALLIALLLMLARPCESARDAGPSAEPVEGAGPAPARIVHVEGDVRVEEDRARPGRGVLPGAKISLADGARVVVEFQDGAELTVRGPGAVTLTESSRHARSVDLESGAIERYEGKDVTTGIRTADDVFVAVRNGTVTVAVEEKPDLRRTTFVLIEGADARAVDGTRILDLTIGKPVVVERPR